MAKSVRIKWNNGTIVYGKLSHDGSSVFVWTKDVMFGGYRIDRFKNRTLTARNLETVLKGE